MLWDFSIDLFYAKSVRALREELHASPDALPPQTRSKKERETTTTPTTTQTQRACHVGRTTLIVWV